MTSPLSAGDAVAGYRLLRLIGEGAHGVVHLARDAAGATVALKLVPLAPGSPLAREQFLAAAATVRRLQHPGIVTAYAAGVEGALGWLAMEPVAGTDLGRYTQPPRLLPEPLVLRVAERVALALAYAHGQGVVHRDLKPANVLVDWHSDTVKLADFGLARGADAEQTATGVVLGSPSYMAPEQLAGSPPSPRSDLYALGVMLFQLLTGRLPHEGASMGELLLRVARDTAPDLRQLRPGLAAPLAGLVGQLLAKQAAQRPADAAALAATLHSLTSAWPAPR
jgi:serine/threonine-protein kinase